MSKVYVRFWLDNNTGFDICCLKYSISLKTKCIYIHDGESLYVIDFDFLCCPLRIESIDGSEAGTSFICYNNVVSACKEYDISYYKEI